MDVTIPLLCSLLTGGFLLLFIENQNIDKEIVGRFFGIMRPFYHKLTQFVNFACEVGYAIRYKDANGEYVPELKKISDRLSKLECQYIFQGRDIPILKSSEIEKLCCDINNIWYLYDKGWIVTDNIYLDEACRYEDRIRTTMRDFPTQYKDMPYDINLLPTIAGNFYVEEWLPIQNITYEYESWKRHSKSCRYLLLASILTTLTSLLILMYVGEKYGVIISQILTIVCSVLFALSLFRLLRLKEQGNSFLIIKTSFIDLYIPKSALVCSVRRKTKILNGKVQFNNRACQKRGRCPICRCRMFHSGRSIDR